jgi:ribosomal protein L22
MYKILSSAIANALHNDMQELSSLAIGSVNVTKGIVYKRGNPISR